MSVKRINGTPWVLVAFLVQWDYAPKSRIIVLFDPIKHGKLIDDLGKLVKSHPKNFATQETAQEWTDRTLISHERTSVHFLVLPGSLFSFTEITELTYISLI